MNYRPDWHESSLRDAPGLALERIDPAGASDDPANWGTSAAPAGGTPGARNALTLDVTDPNVPAAPGLAATPAVFSPDGDGVDDVVRVVYRLKATTSSVRARVYDARGRHVRTLEQAAPAAGTGQVAWDGFDADGNALPLGPYVVVVDAVDTRAGRAEQYRTVVTLARRLN